MTAENWDALMHNLDFGQNRKTYEAIKEAYSEPHRHYHTLSHIDTCLHHLARVETSASQPDEIAIALWFHDAIYSPYANDNEARSADWAAKFLEANSAENERIDRVRNLITSTKHDEPTTTSDEALIVDIDLTVLGSDPNTYDAFEKAVREEYKRIPRLIYWSKRKKILKGFLHRERIYQNRYFFELLEKQARENLTNVLAS